MNPDGAHLVLPADRREKECGGRVVGGQEGTADLKPISI